MRSFRPIPAARRDVRTTPRTTERGGSHMTGRRVPMLAGAALVLTLIASPHVWSQSQSSDEINLQGSTLPQIQDRLFGPGGLLSPSGPREVHVRGVVLTPQQAQTFFLGTGSRDFTALVTAIEQAPGRPVRLQGVVETPAAGGTVSRVPFEAKVAGREVKIEGLSLTQAQFDSLVSSLQGVSGLREFKVEAMVDGKRVEAKFENGVVRTQTRDGERRGEDASRAGS